MWLALPKVVQMGERHSLSIVELSGVILSEDAHKDARPSRRTCFTLLVARHHPLAGQAIALHPSVAKLVDGLRR